MWPSIHMCEDADDMDCLPSINAVTLEKAACIDEKPLFTVYYLYWFSSNHWKL